MVHPSPRRVALALAAPVVLGGLTGRHLLDAMNDLDPAALAAVAPDGPAPAARATRRAVVVLIDGADEPSFDRAMADGTLAPVAWTQRVDTGTPSLSRPGYHVLFTGVSQAVAGVRNNSYVGRARVDTLPDRVRAAGGTVAWALETVRWMAELAGRDGEALVGGPRARDVPAVARLAADHTLTVVHWTESDRVGHAAGAASAAYRAAVQASLARAAALRRVLPRETLLFVGSDHGHLPQGGHGGPEAAVTHVRWVRLGDDRVVGDGGRVGATVMAPTLARAMGLPGPRSSTDCAIPAVPGERAPAAECQRARARARRAAGVLARGRDARQFAAVGAAIAVAVAIAARARARGGPALTALAAMSLGALGAYGALGGGWSLSAITSHTEFLARTFGSLAVGASLGWLSARRLGARADDVAVASAMIPLTALAWALGSSGLHLRGEVERLVAPAAGLFPCAASLPLLAAAWRAREVRDGPRGEANRSSRPGVG